MLVILFFLIIPLLSADAETNSETTVVPHGDTPPVVPVPVDTMNAANPNEESVNPWSSSDDTTEEAAPAEGGDVETPTIPPVPGVKPHPTSETADTTSPAPVVESTTSATAETTAETTSPATTTTTTTSAESTTTTTSAESTTTTTSAESTTSTTTTTSAESTTSTTTTTSAESTTSTTTTSSSANTETTEMPTDTFPTQEAGGCPAQCAQYAERYKGDGECDTTCYSCEGFWDGDEFDGGDCEKPRKPEDCPEECNFETVQEWVGDGDCDTTCYNCPDFWDGDKFDGGDCEEERKAGTCPDECAEYKQDWKGDGECDTRCFNCPQFWQGDEFDGGDCESSAQNDNCPEQCVEYVQGWKGDGDCDTRCFDCPQFWEADGEFDGGDCKNMQDPNTGELITNPDDEDYFPDYDDATEEPEYMECPASCTNDRIDDGVCDKVECKYCHGQNGDADFYNAKGVFDGNDCCDDICRQDWVGDGDCDDDSSFWDFSCMHCDFFYDDNGVFDAGDCCASRCATTDEITEGVEGPNKPNDGVCDEICAQCPNFYDADGTFDGEDCEGQKIDPANAFDFDAERADDGWDNPIYGEAYGGGYDDYETNRNDGDETCPQICTDAADDWVGDNECDYNMCKNCESFWKDGVFDNGDCEMQIDEVEDKVDEIREFEREQNDENRPNVTDNLVETEESKWDVKLIGGVAAAFFALICCCYCLYRYRRARYDFDNDSGFGHSYDKGWNEMTSFTNWA